LKAVVADTGPGIPADIIESIFEPYFSTKPPGEGTGLGLAVAHGTVESHKGGISVDSQVGTGSVFTIYLPVTKEDVPPDPQPAGKAHPGSGRILFVDDEAPLVEIGKQFLESSGYCVTATTSSVEALELFRSQPDAFDLLITDATMPGITGDQLVIEVLSIRADMPVILCTGYSKRVSEERARSIGIKAFVYKPVVGSDLTRIVRQVLDDANRDRP
jgi:CheY-like chemotaxis protein